MKSLLIGFEGLDASYKHTNAEALYDHLTDVYDKDIRADHLKIELVSFPRYKHASSWFVREYLNGHYNRFMMDYDQVMFPRQSKLKQVSMFFLADMIDWYSDALRRGLFIKNHIIIFDRYIYSMMYYLIPEIYAKKEHHYQNYFERYLHIIRENPMYEVLPKVDILLKMITSPDAIEKGINKRGRTKDRYEKNLQYLKDVNTFFNGLDLKEDLNNTNYKGLKHQFEIDTVDKDPETIFNDILKKINPIVNRFDKRKW
jgi:hypothetical protein|nr:MAG TPA: Thymidylate kinase [Caudoviricetes sp.]